MPGKQRSVYLSVTVHVRNEAENLPELHSRLLKTCEKIGKPFEIIYIENASTDNTLEVLKTLKRAKIVVLRWKPYMGKAQSLAMDAGFKEARGEIVVSIDGDLQVEPESIPSLIELIEKQNFDAVTGWRKDRAEYKGKILMLPVLLLRKLFESIRHKLLNEGIHDPGSSLKAFKKSVIANINLYGEKHRFLIAILKSKGYKIAEVIIPHHPRKHGLSKYNISKGVRSFPDLLYNFVAIKYPDRPMQGLGTFGSLLLAASASMFALEIILKLYLTKFHLENLLLSIIVLLATGGIQFIIAGILAEMIIAVNNKQGTNPHYTIEETITND